MRLGLYVFATLVLIGIVGGLAYTVNSSSYAIELMGINLNFPIAIWIVLPMFVLFLFTLLHLFFYGFKNYLLRKKWQKDTLTLEDALFWSLVNEPKEQKYTIDEIGALAVILSKASLEITDNIEGLSPRLSRVLHTIQKIKNGEYIDLKEHKLTKTFTFGNPILRQNRLNRLSKDTLFVEEVMKSSSEYTQEVQDEALRIFAQEENFVNAQKYIKKFNVEQFLVMLERMTSKNNLGLTTLILNDFVKSLNLECEDFIRIVLTTKKYFKPDENLLLFRGYQIENEKAQCAYLYLLFEYELLEQIGLYLNEQEENEFMKFRALYELKKLNTKYKLEDIIDITSVCHETRLY